MSVVLARLTLSAWHFESLRITVHAVSDSNTHTHTHTNDIPIVEIIDYNSLKRMRCREIEGKSEGGGKLILSKTVRPS